MLELRKRIKSKKPAFIRQDAHKKSRVSKNWRRPKGIQAKMRLGIKGYRRCVEPGWGSPRAVKHLHSSGLIQITVYSLSGLKGIDQKTQGILIASSVGQKKRLEIVKEAKKAGIRILNIKDPESFVKSVEDSLAERKQKKSEAAKQKEEKTREKEKKAKEKEEKKDSPKDDLTGKIEAEEKKKQETREKEKILTQKE